MIFISEFCSDLARFRGRRGNHRRVRWPGCGKRSQWWVYFYAVSRFKGI